VHSIRVRPFLLLAIAFVLTLAVVVASQQSIVSAGGKKRSGDDDAIAVGPASRGDKDLDRDDGRDERDGRSGSPRYVVLDKFKGPAVSLDLHAPNIDAVGGGWNLAYGPGWEITASAADMSGLGQTQVALIDGSLEDIDLSVVFTRSGQSGSVGLVFRWQDADNHFRAIYDGKKARLQKVAGGVVSELGSRKVSWKRDKTKTLRVTDNGGKLAYFVDRKMIATVTDSDFRGNTAVGMLYRNDSATAVEDFHVKALALEPAAAADAPGPVIIHDAFDDATPGMLDGRHVNGDAGQPIWSDVVGTWEVTGEGTARLLTASGSGDQIAAVPIDADEVEISADIEWNAGVAGLAWAVDAPGDRSIAFWDGFGAIVAGRIDPVSGWFIEYGRAPYSWARGETRNLRVRINGSNARIYVDDPSTSDDDGRVLVLAIGTDMGSLQRAGLFSKSPANLFDEFLVRVAAPLRQADPVLYVAPPQVLDPPSLPAGARVYDSFTFYNGDLIQNRPPDLDPSGTGWSVKGGTWRFFSFQVGQLYEDRGDQLPFIDTGVDQYEIESEQLWDGGRTGIAFGATRPDSRNTFLFFKQADDSVVLGKKIGGVFFTLGTSRVRSWKFGKDETLKVQVRGDRLKAYVGKRKVFDVTDGDLPGATWAGLFRNGFHTDRFDDFLVRLAPGALEPTPVPPPVPVVVDDFERGGTLVGTAPPLAPPSATWVQMTWFDPERTLPRGEWEMSGGTVSELGTSDYGFADRRAAVESGLADAEVSIEITRGGTPWTTWFGRYQIPRMGLSARVSADGSQWVILFYDGMADLVAYCNSGPLGRAVGVSWPVGATRTLGVRAAGDSLTFSLDGVPQFSTTHSGGQTNTLHGLFSADIETGFENLYDNFMVTPLE